MPLYEYECDACGHRFERIQKFSDPPAETCTSCSGGPVRKLLSSPAFQFKGTGWYVTDYARKGSSPGGEGGAKADGEGGTKPSGEGGEKAAGESAGKPAAESGKADSGTSRPTETG